MDLIKWLEPVIENGWKETGEKYQIENKEFDTEISGLINAIKTKTPDLIPDINNLEDKIFIQLYRAIEFAYKSGFKDSYRLRQ